MIRPALLLVCCLAPLLLAPAASATTACAPLTNPNDHQPEACVGNYTTSRGAVCYFLVADPPVPGMYEYEVLCGPDGQTIQPCNIPVVDPRPCD